MCRLMEKITDENSESWLLLFVFLIVPVILMATIIAPEAFKSIKYAQIVCAAIVIAIMIAEADVLITKKKEIKKDTSLWQVAWWKLLSFIDAFLTMTYILVIYIVAKSVTTIEGIKQAILFIVAAASIIGVIFALVWLNKEILLILKGGKRR